MTDHRHGQADLLLPPRRQRKVLERTIQKRAIRDLGSIVGVRFTRNNVGATKTENGGWLEYGLGTGSPDTVGIITLGGGSSAVPRLSHWAPIAFAFAIEFKMPGKDLTKAQRAWHSVARKRGMFVGCAHSEEEARDLVLGFVRQLDRRFA